MSGDHTSKPDKPRAEFDFHGGTRGKYIGRYEEGSNVVVLAPDVAAIFKTGEAVNDALREYLKKKA
jgi:hypothetical protein